MRRLLNISFFLIFLYTLLFFSCKKVVIKYPDKAYFYINGFPDYGFEISTHHLLNVDTLFLDENFKPEDIFCVCIWPSYKALPKQSREIHGVYKLVDTLKCVNVSILLSGTEINIDSISQIRKRNFYNDYDELFYLEIFISKLYNICLNYNEVGFKVTITYYSYPCRCIRTYDLITRKLKIIK